MSGISPEFYFHSTIGICNCCIAKDNSLSPQIFGESWWGNSFLGLEQDSLDQCPMPTCLSMLIINWIWSTLGSMPKFLSALIGIGHWSRDSCLETVSCISISWPNIMSCLVSVNVTRCILKLCPATSGLSSVQWAYSEEFFIMLHYQVSIPIYYLLNMCSNR